MDLQSYKEVHFHEYCKKCKHKDVPEKNDPCNECLGEATNMDTHRPVRYEAKESK